MPTFSITFTASPDAYGGYLDYRYILPDGSFSPWETCLSVGGPGGFFLINTTTVTFPTVYGNPPDFAFNTTYQFRVRQLCQLDDTFQTSPVDGDYYVSLCPTFTMALGEFAQPSGAFPIEVTIPSTVGYSVVDYIFKIYDPTDLVNPLTTQTVPSSIVDASLPYTFVFDDNNVPGGIVQGTAYVLNVGISIITSTGTDTIDCPNKQLQVPMCYLWKVLTGDDWVLEWTDCNGQNLFCAGKAPYNINGNTDLYVCSPTKPIGYKCNLGVPTPTIINPSTGLPQSGALVISTPAGPCDPMLYNYNTSVSPPVLNGKICQTCP